MLWASWRTNWRHWTGRTSWLVVPGGWYLRYRIPSRRKNPMPAAVLGLPSATFRAWESSKLYKYVSVSSGSGSAGISSSEELVGGERPSAWGGHLWARDHQGNLELAPLVGRQNGAPWRPIHPPLADFGD